jgi:tetratricopeptide (TPR) repeat protein
MAQQDTSREQSGYDEMENTPLEDPEAVDLLSGDAETRTGETYGLSQEDIDALLAGVDEADALDEQMQQTALQALEQGSSPAAEDKPAELDEGIDELLAAADDADGDDASGQEQVDALLRSAQAMKAPATVDAKPPHEDGLLDQNDLDALIASVQGGGASSQGAKTSKEHSASALAKPVDAAAAGEPSPATRRARPREDLSELLAAVDDEEAESEMGAFGMEPVTGDPVEAENASAVVADAALGQEELDSLVSSILDQKQPHDTDAAPNEDGGLLDQEFLDELLSGAAEATPKARISAGMVVDDGVPLADEGPDVGGENLAAAATAEDAVGDTAAGLRVLDRLAAGKRKNAGSVPSPRFPEPTEEEPGPVAKPAVVLEPKLAPTPTPKRAKISSQVAPLAIAYAKQHAAKLSLALAAGLVVGLTTFTYLYVNPTREPGLEMQAFAKLASLEEAVQAAEGLIEQGNYAAADQRLTQALEGIPADASTRDARHLRLRARFAALPDGPVPQATAQALHDEIDTLVQESPSHVSAPQALMWKADLFARDNALYAARDTYERVLTFYGSIDDLDKVLEQAAHIALELKQPGQAGEYLRRLLRDMPGSPRAAQAKLMLGDANAAVGDIVNARRIYQELADSQPGTALGAKAYARLGQMAYDEGEYPLAISILEDRLATATTLDGNDEVYLLLAQSYRAAGQTAESERVLQELLNFLPESEVTPLAFVELSRVLQDLGRERDAARTAGQALQHYPGNAAVLRRQGEMLAVVGDATEAARALEAARGAGASDPKLLLEAGRRLAQEEDFTQAQDTYEQLQRDFPGSPEAFDGAIELAGVLYKSGQVQMGLEGLEKLTQATRGRPQHLPALLALGALYNDAGLTERAVQAFEQVAAQANDPQTLAQAARAMLSAGAVEQGLAAAQRVEPARLVDAEAYSLLTACGGALLQVDPRRAVEVLEGARTTYPDQTAAEGDLLLLDAYLASGQTARARALVMDFDTRARRDPAALGDMQQAAVAWGDHLFERGDYRAAADAYLLALKEGAPSTRDSQWACFQRANALLALSEYEQSLALYDELSQTTNPWAEASRVKADYARLEQRLRNGAEQGEQAG